VAFAAGFFRVMCRASLLPCGPGLAVAIGPAGLVCVEKASRGKCKPSPEGPR
jgi:hypothetical protein